LTSKKSDYEAIIENKDQELNNLQQRITAKDDEITTYHHLINDQNIKIIQQK